jgi:hypothetical protein
MGKPPQFAESGAFVPYLLAQREHIGKEGHQADQAGLLAKIID